MAALVDVRRWLEFRVFDHDDLSSDDFLGSGRINMGLVCVRAAAW